MRLHINLSERLKVKQITVTTNNLRPEPFTLSFNYSLEIKHFWQSSKNCKQINIYVNEKKETKTDTKVKNSFWSGSVKAHTSTQ